MRYSPQGSARLRVHARALGDLVDGAAWAVHGHADQIQAGTVNSTHRGPVVPVVACREEIRGEDGQGDAPADGALAGFRQGLLACFEYEDRLAEHRQVLRSVRVRVRLADHFRVPLPDAADQERGHIQPLPYFQVVAQQNRDLGVEPDRLAV